jgi:hypothetical protein
MLRIRASCHCRRTKEQDPTGPVFAVCLFAYFNNRGGRSCDDDDGGDAGIAATLPPSETYSRGGDDGGGEIGPVAPLHLLTAWTSSTACSSKLAFGIGSSNSAKELALKVSELLSAVTAPNSPAIFFSMYLYAVPVPPTRQRFRSRSQRRPEARDYLGVAT